MPPQKTIQWHIITFYLLKVLIMPRLGGAGKLEKYKINKTKQINNKEKKILSHSTVTYAVIIHVHVYIINDSYT